MVRECKQKGITRTSSFREVVCGKISVTSSGAQTERRGDAGPVRGLLGGKDLTGRL
jgi:hypothetical protein